MKLNFKGLAESNLKIKDIAKLQTPLEGKLVSNRSASLRRNTSFSPSLPEALDKKGFKFNYNRPKVPSAESIIKELNEKANK